MTLDISVMNNLLSGGLIAGLETTVGTPLNNIKLAWQQGQKIPSFSQLWTGSSINALYCSSVTAPQFAVTQYMKNLLSKGGKNELYVQDRLAIAASSAFVSAFIATPAEMVMTTLSNQKQRYKEGELKEEPTYKTARRAISKQYGRFGFFRGFFGIVFRDTSFVASYSSGTQYLREKATEKGVHYMPATVFSGILSGVLGAFIGHPGDTDRMYRQTGEKRRLKPLSGVSARVFRIAIAVPIYTFGADFVTEQFAKMKI